MRIGLFMNLSHTKGRRLLRGIHAELEHWPEAEPVNIPYHLRLWEGDPLAGLDGVLAEFDRYPQAVPFWDIEIPVINISDALPTKHFPKSVIDEERIGQLAADHLIERGYERFLCLGAEGHHAAELRAAAFAGQLESKGRTVTCLKGWFGPDNVLAEALSGELHNANSAIGIFGWTDFSAYSAVKVARGLGKRIPEEVGVLGAGNDDVFTSISPVPLSSIDLHWESVGSEAVRMLREALEGGRIRNRPEDRQMTNCQLIQRASTERYPVSDAIVARCLALIERDLSGDLSIDTLAERVGCSRRSLELRFKRGMHKTTARYILERRIKRARRLLRETHLHIYEIATACGFEDANYFAAAFKRVEGMSPTAFREQAAE